MQRDLAYMRDIPEAARLVLSYMKGVNRQAFEQNTQLQDAVIRRLEINGEAARCVSDETMVAHAGIPWRQMIGMRNQVIHMYDEINTLSHLPYHYPTIKRSR